MVTPLKSETCNNCSCNIFYQIKYNDRITYICRNLIISKIEGSNTMGSRNIISVLRCESCICKSFFKIVYELNSASNHAELRENICLNLKKSYLRTFANDSKLKLVENK
jgi:hypothetical protein